MATVYPEFEVGDYVMVNFGGYGPGRKYDMICQVVGDEGLASDGNKKYRIQPTPTGLPVFHVPFLRYAGATELAEYARAELTGKDRAEALRQAVRNRLLYGKGG